MKAIVTVAASSLLAARAHATYDFVNHDAVALQRAALRQSPESSYVLRGFPDMEHAAAVVLSQSDAAKICFRLCFNLAARGADGDEYHLRLAVRRMYELMIAGATSGPGEIEPAAADGAFSGEAGFRARAREQLTHEFGCDPLATTDDAGALEFGADEIEAVLAAIFPDGGEGAAHGESLDALRTESCGGRRVNERRETMEARRVVADDDDPDAWINDVYEPGKDEL